MKVWKVSCMQISENIERSARKGIALAFQSNTNPSGKVHKWNRWKV